MGGLWVLSTVGTADPTAGGELLEELFSVADWERVGMGTFECRGGHVVISHLLVWFDAGPRLHKNPPRPGWAERVPGNRLVTPSLLIRQFAR